MKKRNLYRIKKVKSALESEKAHHYPQVVGKFQEDWKKLQNVILLGMIYNNKKLTSPTFVLNYSWRLYKCVVSLVMFFDSFFSWLLKVSMKMVCSHVTQYLSHVNHKFDLWYGKKGSIKRPLYTWMKNIDFFSLFFFCANTDCVKVPLVDVTYNTRNKILIPSHWFG